MISGGSGLMDKIMKKRIKKRLLMKQEIDEHTASYVRIPFNPASIGRFCLMLLSALLSYINFLLLIKVGNDYGVWELLSSLEVGGYFINWNMMIIVYLLIVEFLLIGLTAICFVAFMKKGFRNIKSYKEEGLIFGLIIWLIFGLIIGLIIGLIGGLIIGLIIWLIIVMIIWLIFGLIIGLITGLIEEFN